MQTLPDHKHTPSAFGIPASLVLCVFLLAAVFFLWTEHRAHLLGYAFWGLLLLCPLMHVLMHGGHGGHGAEHPAHHAGDHARRDLEEP